MATTDGALVFSKTVKKYVDDLFVSLNRMRARGLTVNPVTVQLPYSRVKLLEYVVHQCRARPKDQGLKKTLEYPPVH